MKKTLLPFLRSGILPFFFIGCSQVGMDRAIRDWHDMRGYGGYGGVFMWLVVIIIAGLIAYFVFNRSKTIANQDKPARESPTEILKRRYARGEITKKEFQRLKKDIES